MVADLLSFVAEPASLRAAMPAEAASGARHWPVSGVRRRHRAVQSCFPCRSRKLKCDKQRPCKTCQNADRDCSSDPPGRTGVSYGQRHVAAQIPLRRLETTQESLAPRPSSPLENVAETLQSHRSFEIDKVSFVDAVYEDATGQCPVDLGVQLGRMRLTERLGGYHHPKLTQELDSALRVVQRRNNMKSPEHPSSVTTIQGNAPIPGYLQPNPDYLSPSDGFFFCSGFHPGNIDRSFLNLNICQNILNHYWGTSHILSKCLHRPSFEKRWATFWTFLSRGLEPPPSMEAVVMAVLLSGTLATPDLTLTHGFGARKSNLLNSFKAATESALIRAKFIHSTELETLQALIIYLIALCSGQLSKDHVALLGVTIGIAETIGLHRDPTCYNFNAEETHVRRLLWHQLCFLDLRACEAHRPRPQIREDEFDAIIPPSVNDQELNKPVDADVWTDTSFSIMNFECSVIHRVIWITRPRLEKKEVDVPTVLGWVMDFRTRMLDKYAFLKDEIPIQKYARLVLEILISKLFSMVLHRYHRPINNRLPERIHQLLIDQVIVQLTNVLTLETMPELSPWSWHVGAWNHYRTVLIILEEVSINPGMPKADTIWRILDYIFLQPPGLTPDEKSIAILSEAKERLAVYRRLKKMKVPTGINSRITPGTELALLPSSQDYHTAGTGFAGSERTLNNASLSSTADSGSTEVDFNGESQYSPYADIGIIEDIDWTRWDAIASGEFNSITDA